MRVLGIKRVVRGKKFVTTNPDTSQPCPDHKVNRRFKAGRPNKLWLSDFTDLPTRSVTVYVAFMIDVFPRQIAGWRASTLMKTQFVLDASDQAIWHRNTLYNNILAHNSDRGSHYLPTKYTKRLASAKIDPSVGSAEDADDNALAECVIGLCKTEVINQIGPWKSMRDSEWEPLKWVDWHNNARGFSRTNGVHPRTLLGPIGFVPFAEAEQAFHIGIRSIWSPGR